MLASGVWGNYPYTIHTNPDKALLLVVYDKTGDSVSGLLVSMRQPLAVEGDLSKFILAQKREMIYQEKFAGGTRYAYLFVGSSPAYIPYSSDDLLAEVKKQYLELNTLAKTAKELVDGYGAKARFLEEAGDEWVQALLGDPLSLIALSKPLGPLREEAFAKSNIGLNLEGEEVTVKIESLARALVVGATPKDRKHGLHLLAEAAVLANMPIVIFDSDGAFEGLAVTNDKTAAFEEFGMKPMPVSFQFKSFELGRNLFVDPALLNSDQFLTAFGLLNTDIASLFKQVYEARKAGFATLDDLATELGRIPESRENPQYLISKAVRAVRIIQRAAAGVFGRSLTPELLRPWQDNLGRVHYVNLRGVRPQLANLVLASFLQNMVPAPTKRTSAVVILSNDMRELLPLTDSLKRFDGSGIGLAIHAENESDASFLREPTLRIEFITPKEAALTELGEKRVRLRLRPAYSKCTEESAPAPAPAPAQAPAEKPAAPAAPASKPATPASSTPAALPSGFKPPEAPPGGWKPLQRR